MNDRALWNLMYETWDAIRPHFEPVFERMTAKSGVDAPAWMLLLSALTFEPDNITPAHLMVRGPYTAAESYLTRLEAAAEKGYLTEVTPGAFFLTAVGRTETQQLVEQARAAMAAADPLLPADSHRLTRLLDRLVWSCLKMPPPPDIWSIHLSHRLMPAADPPLPYLEQAFTCLAAYRDDAHLAAWQESDLTATALESLTCVWRGQVNSLDGLEAQLAHRGHPLQVYADALNELRERKFTAGSRRALRLTEAGKLFRDQVEADTDHYFYKPWAVLNQAEKTEMGALLVSLRDGLKT